MSPSPVVYPAVRPLSKPSSYVRHTPATRALAAHLWETRLLGTPGDNGDPLTNVFARAFADDARRAFARAAYTVMDSEVFVPVMDSEVFVPGWREGEGHWSNYNLALGVDYHPDIALLAAEGLMVAAGHAPVRVWPMKSSTSVCDTHATIREGYGAAALAYYPLEDGRVLEVTGATLTAELAEDIARAMDDGCVFDGVGTYYDAAGAPHDPFNWRVYLGLLDPTAEGANCPRYNPRPGDTCNDGDTVYTVQDVGPDGVLYTTWVDDTGTGSLTMALGTWANDTLGGVVWARPAAS